MLDIEDVLTREKKKKNKLDKKALLNCYITLVIIVIIVKINVLFTNTSLLSLRLIVPTPFLFMPFTFIYSLLSTRTDYIFAPKNSSVPTLFSNK